MLSQWPWNIMRRRRSAGFNCRQRTPILSRMKALVHVVKVFAVIFTVLCVVAAIIFPFTEQQGLRGYVLVLLAVSAAWTGLGALWVYSANKSPLSISGTNPEASDDPMVREIAKDLNQGATLGLEAFYSGLASVLIVYSIYKDLTPE